MSVNSVWAQQLWDFEITINCDSVLYYRWILICALNCRLCCSKSLHNYCITAYNLYNGSKRDSMLVLSSLWRGLGKVLATKTTATNIYYCRRCNTSLNIIFTVLEEKWFPLSAEREHYLNIHNKQQIHWKQKWISTQMQSNF